MEIKLAMFIQEKLHVNEDENAVNFQHSYRKIKSLASTVATPSAPSTIQNTTSIQSNLSCSIITPLTCPASSVKSNNGVVIQLTPTNKSTKTLTSQSSSFTTTKVNGSSSINKQKIHGVETKTNASSSKYN